jgi:hypothetical protein
MSLLDKYLPVYQFAERHGILVNGSPGEILDAIQAYDPSTDRLSRRLSALRELPGRWLASIGFAGTSKPFGLTDFIPLDRDGDREMAAGLVGRFWRLDYGLVPLPDAAAFTAFARPGTAKLVIGFRAEPRGDCTRLVTETRVHCPDRRSLLKFTPYWLVIRLPSGYIRRRFLAAVRQIVENRESVALRVRDGTGTVDVP